MPISLNPLCIVECFRSAKSAEDFKNSASSLNPQCFVANPAFSSLTAP